MCNKSENKTGSQWPSSCFQWLSTCFQACVILILIEVIVVALLINLDYFSLSNLFTKFGGGVHNNTEPTIATITTSNKPVNAPTKPMSLTDYVYSKYVPYWKGHKEILVEDVRTSIKRSLSDFELAGSNIILTVKTTKRFHASRLPLMLDTWLTTVNASNTYIITDDKDKIHEDKCKHLGINYIIAKLEGVNRRSKLYKRDSMCYKAGAEMELMFKEANRHIDWLCHVDDDMYVNMKNLINFLAKFDPKNESIYVGYPGNGWLQPHNLNSKQKIFKGKKKLNCHFSLGAMYCISRPLVEEMKPWLGSRATLRETCEKLSDPDDVTIGCSIEYFTTKRLTRTHLILPHTINLSKFNNLQKYVGIGYGCGQRCKKGDKTMNAVVVPNAKFSTKDDPTRFKSLHCHLHPHATLCVS